MWLTILINNFTPKRNFTIDFLGKIWTPHALGCRLVIVCAKVWKSDNGFEYQILFEAFTHDSAKLWTPEFLLLFFDFGSYNVIGTPHQRKWPALGYFMLLHSCRLPSKKIWRTPTPWDFDSGSVLASNDQKGDLKRIHWNLFKTMPYLRPQRNKKRPTHHSTGLDVQHCKSIPHVTCFLEYIIAVVWCTQARLLEGPFERSSFLSYLCALRGRSCGALAVHIWNIFGIIGWCPRMKRGWCYFLLREVWQEGSFICGVYHCVPSQ